MADIFGTPGPDTRTGTALADTISLLAGNDTANGGGGTDSLFGDADDDDLTGGAGRDTMEGGAGRDFLIATAPSEVVAGEIYDGGSQDDGISTFGDGTFDFRGTTILSIEQLAITSPGGQSVRLNSSQINDAGFSPNSLISLLGGTGSSEGIEVFVDNGSVDLSGLQFTGFESPLDFVTIRGTSSTEVMTGSGVADTFITNGGSDIIEGGGGTDKVVLDFDLPDQQSIARVGDVLLITDPGTGQVTQVSGVEVFEFSANGLTGTSLTFEEIVARNTNDAPTGGGDDLGLPGARCDADRGRQYRRCRWYSSRYG